MLKVVQVWWESVDDEGRPVVVIRLKHAVDQCTDKAAADKVAKAVTGQVRLAPRVCSQLRPALSLYAESHELQIAHEPTDRVWSLLLQDTGSSCCD